MNQLAIKLRKSSKLTEDEIKQAIVDYRNGKAQLDKVYAANYNMIYKACLKTLRASANHLDFEDIESFASQLFMNAVNKFNVNQKKAKFSTFLHTQLMRLYELIGASYKRNEETGELESNVNFDDVDTDNADRFSEVLGAEYQGSYCKNLIEKCNDDIEKFSSYEWMLTSDAKQMMVDFCNGFLYGEFGKNISENARLEANSNISPRVLWTRWYAKKGWTLDRVKEARASLEVMLDQYRHGKIGNKLTKMSSRMQLEPLF